jgi:hypothetical protein
VIDSRHINNGTLNDEDIGQTTLVDITGSVGVVPARSCIDRSISGINAAGDHLLLTPEHGGFGHNLSYEVHYRPDTEAAFLHVCNPTNADINDEAVGFNLLVIDAR